MIYIIFRNCINNTRRERKWRNVKVGLGPAGNPIVEELTKIFKGKIY